MNAMPSDCTLYSKSIENFHSKFRCTLIVCSIFIGHNDSFLYSRRTKCIHNVGFITLKVFQITYFMCFYHNNINYSLFIKAMGTIDRQFIHIEDEFKEILTLLFNCMTIIGLYNDFTYRWYVIWIIFEIHVLNLSVKIWGYCILIGFLANKMTVRMLWLVQNQECSPWDCFLTLRFNMRFLIENSDVHSCFTLYSLGL